MPIHHAGQQRSRAATPLIVRGPDETFGRWQAFIAGLCFIEFYDVFVRSGTRGWGMLGEARRINQLQLDWPSADVIMTLLRAIAFLLLGRALWRGHGIRLWTGIAVVTTIAGFVTAAQSTVWQYRASTGIPLFTPPTLGSVFAGELIQFLPWGFLLVTGIIAAYRPRMGLYRGRPPWVLVAGSWCAGLFAASALPVGLNSNWMWTGFSFWVHDVPWFSPVAIAAPALLSVAMLSGWRATRLIALACAILNALPGVAGAYVITDLVNTAINALMYSIPGNPQNPIPWPWILFNQHFFQATAVEAVAQAGPFLFIAYFARRYRLRAPVDDGSPYPRIYCGKCLYNLRGLQGDVCPECGTRLLQAARAETSTQLAEGTTATGGGRYGANPIVRA